MVDLLKLDELTTNYKELVEQHKNTSAETFVVEDFEIVNDVVKKDFAVGELDKVVMRADDTTSVIVVEGFVA